MNSGTVGSGGFSSGAFGTNLRRGDFGKNGSLPKLGSSLNTDLGALGGTIGEGVVVSARRLATRSRHTVINKRREVKRRCMVVVCGSGGDGVDQRHNLHFERELFLIALRVRVAGRGWIQFDVLDTHVRERILEIGDEPAEVVK